MTRDQILLWCGLIVALGAAFAVFWKLATFLWGLGKKANVFFEDWNGTPARPGVAAVPGVMARLDAQDMQAAESDARLKRLEWHVGNGSEIALRAIVEGNCMAIDDLTGLIGTRRGDKKRPAAKKGN